jgi:hypothetical protein
VKQKNLRQSDGGGVHDREHRPRTVRGKIDEAAQGIAGADLFVCGAAGGQCGLGSE